MSERRRFLIWVAVSSREQAGEDKASLPTQERDGRAFAEANGGVVVDVLTVLGHTRGWPWPTPVGLWT